MQDRRRTGEGRYEFATDSDPSLNYCLWPYGAPTRVVDKFRSVNLLYQSFDVAGIDPGAFRIVDAIRDGIGPFRTVYGIKFVDGCLGWEFYFYDYARRSRAVSASRVQQAMASLVPSTVKINESLPYFMFSLDLDDEMARGARGLDAVHLYIGNPGSAVSSGIAYTVSANATRLDNFYFFFDAATQMGDVHRKVASSPFVDETALSLDAVILPMLRNCKTICVANKQTHDCIYFSGIDVRQLEWFLTEFSYPLEIRSFVSRHRDNLDHLLYDVGIDYRQQDGSIQILKSGYYGVF